MNSIGEMKDIYTIARHVGIPGTKIDNFIKAAAMCGYILVRATVEKPTYQPSAADSRKQEE